MAADPRFSEWIRALSNDAELGCIRDLIPEFALEWADLPEEGLLPQVFEATVRRPNCESLPVQVSLVRLRGGDGDLLLVEIVAVSSVPPDQMPTDAVTGLADRRALAPHRSQWANSPSPVPHAVLFLDLNGFKQVNDLFGHAVGDQILAELAVRWRHCIREGDLIVRYGGDEFVILLGHVSSRHEIAPIVQRLQLTAQQPFLQDGTQVEISATIGVALAADTSVDLEELLAAADRDMYAGKAKKQE